MVIRMSTRRTIQTVTPSTQREVIQAETIGEDTWRELMDRLLPKVFRFSRYEYVRTKDGLVIKGTLSPSSKLSVVVRGEKLFIRLAVNDFEIPGSP